MTQYILSEDADHDLDGIWDYIAEDNVDAADRWIGRLFDAFDAIGDAPGIGHKREDLTAYPVLFAHAIFPLSCTAAFPSDS